MSSRSGRAESSAATPNKLAAKDLRRSTEASSLQFKTTDDLEALEGMIGQRRSQEAIDLATKVEKTGFNLFAVGSIGLLSREAVIETLKAAAQLRAQPLDWVYVNNFKEPHKPFAIDFPAGQAEGFQKAMNELVDDLRAGLPAVFQSEEYQTRRGTIDEDFQKAQGEAFADLQKQASESNIVLLRTPMGFALVPAREGKVMPPEEFNKLPESERDATHKKIEELEKELERIIRQIPRWEKDRREAIRKLNRETAQAAVDPQVDEVVRQFPDLPKVQEYLEATRADVIENIFLFTMKASGEEGSEPESGSSLAGPLDRYRVNLLVSQDDTPDQAPVIEELHPTLANLTGRIEHIASQGVLITNFRLIKPGALHRANGGFLLMDARALLSEAFSWTALKRALRRRSIVVEDINRLIGLSSTISLEPEPIPLDVKVVLFGDRLVHLLLAMFDPEFEDHFKIVADFEDDMPRSGENEMLMARSIASMLKREDMRPMERDGVVLVIEQAARMAAHGNKLSLSADHIRDILAEADHYAKADDCASISRIHVRRTLDQRIDRASRIRERFQEQILDEVALIDTEGTAVAQINGLSVLELAGFAFGRPTRITCSVGPGAGKVVDIEREVELGGPIHSKGVLILSGFLTERFAIDAPLSLNASLVFEQSYSGVEGDSASSAELYVLLSALSNLPLRQDLAVTGSVNQHGVVQAIGAVNEKIEGFYDICKARGLTGTQGVLIPRSNVQHLMLRDDVIEACEKGNFAIYPIGTIDQGFAMLTGQSVGVRDENGHFPEGTAYGSVENRLQAFAEIRRSIIRRSTDKEES